MSARSRDSPGSRATARSNGRGGSSSIHGFAAAADRRHRTKWTSDRNRRNSTGRNRRCRPRRVRLLVDARRLAIFGALAVGGRLPNRSSARPNSAPALGRSAYRLQRRAKGSRSIHPRFRAGGSVRRPLPPPAEVRAWTTAEVGSTAAVVASAQDAAIGGVGGWLSWQVGFHCRDFATWAKPRRRSVRLGPRGDVGAHVTPLIFADCRPGRSGAVWCCLVLSGAVWCFRATPESAAAGYMRKCSPR